MKKLFFLVTLLFISANFFAQETITVNKKDLPKNVLKKIEKKQKVDDLKENITTVKEITRDAKSIGHEIGVAVDEALGAVTKHADKFGKTDVGKFTMTMVAVAVLKDQIPFVYKSIIGLLIGVPFLIFINILLYKIFMKTTQKKRIITTEEDGKKTYSYVDTWFTKEKADDELTGTFIIGFWVIALISNLWIIIGMIF